MDHREGIKQILLSLIPRNIVTITFVDFKEKSTSISVESTFETLISEIDTRIQYSYADLEIKSEFILRLTNAKNKCFFYNAVRLLDIQG